MPAAYRNPFEAAARADKVTFLCMALAGHVSARDAERMTDAEWALAAKLAEVRMPSQETRQAVIDVLKRNESRRPANPFPKY